MNKIIDYSDKWREGLKMYMHKVFPNYTDDYVQYCLNHSTDRVPSKLVLNDNDEIVGCHLYFCTKALVNGEEIETQWSHDTHVDEAYRLEVGMELMSVTHTIKGYGLGLTEMADKIQRKIFKNKFFEAKNYYIINWKVFLSPIQKLLGIKPELCDMDAFKANNCSFKRIENANDINIPPNGYWFKGYRDIEFIRDANFINERFLNCKVHPYILYANETDNNPCYFVVRTTSYRGMPAITLCDYRYVNNSQETLSCILKAVKEIAIKSNIGIILFMCGDVNMDKILKNSFHFSKPVSFVSNRKIDNINMSFIVTGGESDADFLKN